MPKFVGYYCGAFPKDEGLLNDMVETWGGTFEKLNNAQRLWIVKSIANVLFEQHPMSEQDAPNDSEVEEVIERLNELMPGDMVGLLEALIAQIKHYNN
ncbi:hypothetical protein NIES2101_24020 [Calothrix sp. HK-06]|nr:hypothetical protein NIES2101_23885 [Calothrix sp. HK-06]OKH47335.1 hypothetical protein NIES2101_24020 [Calothrix sp. HK-06]